MYHDEVNEHVYPFYGKTRKMFSNGRVDRYETLQWGTLKCGAFAYVIPWVGDLIRSKSKHKFPIDGSLIREHGTQFIAFNVDGNALVIREEDYSDFIANADMSEFEELSGGVYALGSDFANDLDLDIYSMLYVPFAPGPNGSKLPVIWRGDPNWGVYSTLRNPLPGTCDIRIDHPGITVETIKYRFKCITARWPKADLSVNDYKRYVIIEVTFDGGTPTNFIYNCNHIATNCGRISDAEASRPLSIMAIMKVDKEGKECSYEDFLKKTSDDWFIGDSDDAARRIAGDASDCVENTVKDKFKFSDNPLLAAAERVAHEG